MNNLPPVVLLGSFSIDRIMNYPGRYEDQIRPDKLHVLSLSVLIERLEHSRGGVAANIAYNLSLLGESPILLTSVGPDGLDYLQSLSQLGIDTSFVHHSSLPTSTFTVLTDANDCQVGGFYPGAMSDHHQLSLRAWHDTGALVVVSPFDPDCMRRIVQESAKHKLHLVYDIGQQVSNVEPADLTAGIKAAEIIIVNDYELSALSERSGMTPAEIKKQVPVLVTTLGASGSLIEGNMVHKALSIQAVKVDRVVDPTGAGDAYRAGFLYGRRRNWPLRSCGQLGSLLGSYAVQFSGTQKHSFNMQAIMEQYQAYFKEDPWQQKTTK